MRQDHRRHSGERVRSELIDPSNHDHRHFHPEGRTTEGLPQQGDCGVFSFRRERAQHGRDEQVDRSEGDQEDTAGDHSQVGLNKCGSTPCDILAFFGPPSPQIFHNVKNDGNSKQEK